MKTYSRGFTLVELLVSLGLFAVVMLLASGAYLIMIGTTDEAQGLATGSDTLSSALDAMTRTIRTGSGYACDGGGDCPYPAGGTSFTVLSPYSGKDTTFALSDGEITQDGEPLTDQSLTVTSLVFYLTGSEPYSDGGDENQPHVTITVSGTIPTEPGKSVPFTIETGATMRGPDL